MGDFKAWFIHPSLEPPNNLVFHCSIPEAVSEVAEGAVDDTDIRVMGVSMVMDMVAEEDVVEVAMVKTHMNLPAGIENFQQKLVYTLQTNEYSSTHNKK